MNPILAFLGLRGTIAAAIALAFAVIAAVQTWRVQALEADKAEAQKEALAARMDVEACVQANQSVQTVMDAQRRAAERAAQDYAQALAQARRALQQAESDRRAADAVLAQFRERWGAKSNECALALSRVDQSCPEIRSY